MGTSVALPSSPSAGPLPGPLEGVALSLQRGGEAVPGAPERAGAPGLQRNVRPNLAKLDMLAWSGRLAQVGRQVCRIELDGQPAGTGFLVGPSAVLTNWHVVKEALASGALGRMVARFDYARLPDATRSMGVAVGLGAGGCLDSRPYAPAEATTTPDTPSPAASELDYALLHLAEPAGEERGWISLPDAPVLLQPGDPLLIVQHPDGAPMKLAVDTEAVIGRVAGGVRIRYRTNTDPGSSGSPCFTMDWDLAALHHFGDPAWQAPAFNQGIPAELVRRSIVERGAGAWLGGAWLGGTAGPARQGNGAAARTAPQGIPPATFGPVSTLVGQAFTFRDIEAILSRFPGQDALTDIANDDWPPGKVARATLRYAEERGIAKPFLASLLEARPYDDTLRAQLVAAVPDLAEARSTRDSVNAIIGSLEDTRATMGDPVVRRAVATSSGALRAFADKTRVLAAYKDLHDSLHQIQVRRFSDLRAATARLDDPDQHDKLLAYGDLLAPATGVARNAAMRLPDGAEFRAKELTWITQLEAAERELAAALGKSDGDAARLALKVVARVLAREPQQLNRAIFLTAQEVSVDTLTEALDTVGRMSASARATLAGATTELRAVGDALHRRVEDHQHWQDADVLLGELDSVFQQSGASVFAAFSEDWPAAKAAVKRIAAEAAGEDWAKSLFQSADATDDELTRLDAEAGTEPRVARERLYRRYTDFRHGARMRFFRIDQLLKEQCDAIVRVGEPLQAILQELRQ